MTLQASGPIAISDLADEFGGSAPHSLSEYYRGGTLVNDTPPNAGIPTSGPISLTDFYGAQGAGSVAITMTCETWAAGYTSSKTAVQSRGADESHGSFSTTTIGNGFTLQACYWNSVVQLLYLEYTTVPPAADSAFFSLRIQGGGADPDETFLRSTAMKVGNGWVWQDDAPVSLPESGDVTLTITWK